MAEYGKNYMMNEKNPGITRKRENNFADDISSIGKMLWYI